MSSFGARLYKLRIWGHHTHELGRSLSFRRLQISYLESEYNFVLLPWVRIVNEIIYVKHITKCWECCRCSVIVFVLYLSKISVCVCVGGGHIS